MLLELGAELQNYSSAQRLETKLKNAAIAGRRDCCQADSANL